MANEKKLGDYIEKCQTPKIEWKGTSELEVLGVSNVLGITKTAHKKSKDLGKYLVIEPTYFAYNPYRINVGSIGLTPSDKFGLVSPAYVVFKVKKDKLIPELLLDYLKSFYGLQQINKYARGTVRKALRYDDLCKIEVNFPEYKKQETIFKQKLIIEKKNNTLISEIQAQKKLLTQLKQSILQEAIQGKLTSDWRKNNTEHISGSNSATALLKSIKVEKAKLVKDKKIKKEKPLSPISKEEILFELPEGWIWCRLGEVSTYLNGNGFDSSDFGKNSGVKCIKITNAGVREVIETDDTLPFGFSEKYSAYLVYENDIIMALTRPYIIDGLKVSLCPLSYNKALLNQRVAVIRGFKVYNNYIYTYLQLYQKYTVMKHLLHY
jgi:restriction endonuclease S subunit